MLAGGLLNVVYSGGGDNQIGALGNTNALAANGASNLMAAVGNTNVVLANGGKNTVLAAGMGNLVATTVGGNTVAAVGGANVILTEVGGMLDAASGGLGKVLAGAIPDKTVATAINSATGKLSGAIQSGSGKDVVIAVGGTNVIYTGAQDDVVGAIGGNNVLLANGGNNVSTAIGSNNLLINTAGSNVVTTLGSANVVLTGAGEGITDLAKKLDKATTGSATSAISKFLGNNLAKGDGNDIVTAIGGANVVYTGSGNDVVTALGSTNVVWAGAGNDVVTAAGSNNIVWADGGVDLVTAAGNNNLVVTGNYAEVAATAVGLVDAIAAGVAAVDLVGKAGLGGVATSQGGTEVVTVMGKNNVVVGGSGATVVTALGSNNLLVTGAGNDVISAAGSKTGIVAGAGNDVVTALGSYNVLVAGEGNNVVTAVGKGNLISGGSGNDVLTAIGVGSVGASKANLNVLLGGDGNNVMTVVGKDNIAISGSGKDVLVMASYGSQEKTTESGKEGADTTTTSTTKFDTQANVAWTGGGDDTAVLYGSHNVLVADSGNDTVIVVNAGSKLDYKSETTNGANEVVSSTKVNADTGFNFVHAGSGNDTLVLAGTTTVGMGGEGNDVIVTAAQNNIAIGGAGNDVIIGLSEMTVFNAVESLVENDYESAGDWVGAAMNYNFASSQVKALTSGSLSKLNLVGNVLLGGEGNDTVFATNAGTYISGGNGDDVMMGMGWGVITQLLGKNAATLGGAVGGGFADVSKYLGESMLKDLSSGWDQMGPGIKAKLAAATASAAALGTSLDGVSGKALGAVSGVTGVELGDFNVAGGIKGAMNGVSTGVNTAVAGIGKGFSYAADADVAGALADSASFLGSKVAAGSEATFDGLAWLTDKLGLDMDFGDFNGAEGLVGGFLAYLIGYKYAGDNDLHGGAGNDTLYSGMGNDDLRGGSGSDTYVVSMGDGKDTIYESAGGNDILQFAANSIFSGVTMQAAGVKANISGKDLVINYVNDKVSFAKVTIADYASVNMKEVQLIDQSGVLVSTISMHSLIAGAGDSDPYAMTSVWTANHLDAFAELILLGTQQQAA
ncbi:serralysin-like metalloprotease [Massilia sp. CCM 8692]|uniref:Serralysin-like metalloprotease n=1 Tax=Massilia rubra TaxID=2607910 RepID=A0ABX0LU47_9BURK|nr:serralysin-like metalloprotease [Massilia rubra]